MANTADDYASWIVGNAEKKGTPEFATVAQAYEQAKADESAAMQAPEMLPNAEGEVVQEMLPDPMGEMEPVQHNIPEPSSMMEASQGIYGASRAVGDTISDVGGAVVAPLITPEAGRVYEAAAQSVPFSAGISLGVAGLGKIPAVTNYLATRGSGFARSLGATLKEVANDPMTLLKFESGIGALSAATGKTAEEATKKAGVSDDTSKYIGMGVELATAVAAPQRLAQKAFNSDPALRYAVREDAVDATVAKIVRDNPQAAMAAEQRLSDAAALGLQGRLDMVVKDPTLMALTRRLAGADSSFGATYNNLVAESVGKMRSITDDLTTGRLDAGQARDAVEAYASQLENTRNMYLSQIPAESRDIAAVGEEFFDTFIDSIHTGMKEEASKAYGALSGNMQIFKSEVKAPMLAALKEAKARGFASDLINKKSGINQYAKEIKKFLSGDSKTLTAGELNQFRSTLLSDIRVMQREGKNTTALHALVDGVTDTLEKFPALTEANTLYRSFSEGFKRTRISNYFGSKDKVVKSPEHFARDFLISSPKKGARELEKFVNEVGAERGFTMDNAKEMARSGYMAMFKADNITNPKQWGEFIRNNKAGLDAYGLTDEFASFKSLSEKAAKFDLPQAAQDRLVLSKYGQSWKPQVFESALNNNKMAFLKEAANYPKPVQEATRRSAARAMLYDGDVLKSPDNIKQVLSSHGDYLVPDLKQRNTMLALSQMLSKEPMLGAKGVKMVGSTIDVVEEAFQRVPKPSQALISAMLERITRPALKVIRTGRASLRYYNVQELREKFGEVLLTPDGAKRILALAAKEPQARSLFNTILYGRAVGQTAQYPTQENN